MDASRILLTGLIATNKVAGRAPLLLGHSLKKLLGLINDPEHFEAGKAAAVKIATPVLGPPVVRQLAAAANGAEFCERCERFAVENCVASGVESGDISDALWNEAVPPELQMLLPVGDIVALLIDDTSGWWRDAVNAAHLAEVADGLLVDDPSLRGDLANALDLEQNFEKMAADPELAPKLAAFCAGLRAGVRNSDAFDAKLFAAFTVAELVNCADPDMVWGFCQDGLRLAARAVATKTEPPAPAPTAIVTCNACGARYTDGRTSCDCGQPLTASAAVAAS